MRVLDTVAEVPLTDLKLYPGNARQGDLAALAESLRINGQYRPIVVDQDRMQVLAGNHTLMAAKELGWETIKVSYIAGLTETQARKIVIADNRISDLASYDNAALARLLEALPDHEGTGYSTGDAEALIASLVERAEPAALTDPDAIPETPKKPQSKPGDVWQLGPHRLLVGDAAGDLTPLMQGDLADLVLTDPPYNVDYQGGTGLKIQNDKLLTEDFRGLLENAFQRAADHSKAGAGIYVFHADSKRVDFQQAAEQAGWTLRQNLIWVKNSLVLSRQDYHWQHEPILYGWHASGGHSWESDRKQTTVIDDQQDITKLNKAELLELLQGIYDRSDCIRYDRPTKSLEHPTMKPVGLLTYLLGNSSQPGDIVLDPFGGSGSTLIACHQQHRVARLVELDPHYADVICRRYWEHTGDQPRNQRNELFN
jgi:DNA modification methylase